MSLTDPFFGPAVPRPVSNEGAIVAALEAPPDPRPEPEPGAELVYAKLPRGRWFVWRGRSYRKGRIEGTAYTWDHRAVSVRPAAAVTAGPMTEG